MTRGVILSIVLHVSLVVLAVVGLPQLTRERPVADRLVVVDVVTIGAITNAPPPASEAKKPEAPTETARVTPDSPRTPPPPPAARPTPPPPVQRVEPPKVEAPRPEVARVEPPRPEPVRPEPPRAEPPKAEPPRAEPAPPTAPPPPPAPVATEPAPRPEAVAAIEPLPVPPPKPEEAKRPEPETPAPKPVETTRPEPPKAEPAKPRPEAVKAADATPTPPPPIPVSRPTPPQRPTPPTPEPAKPEDKANDFQNVLKTVQKLRDSPARPTETAQNAPRTEDSTARRSNFDADRPLSVSEMDSIRQQIARCWLVPAGAKEGESLLVEIRVVMNPDRTVRDTQIVDTGRMRTDPFFRAAAESALRALRNPSCTPLNLPPEKYETWKNFTITFDPKDMLS